MCGIYFTNRQFDQSTIKKKLDRISYRGPDFQGIMIDSPGRFGHNRLSIIDLDKRSNQPMKIDAFTIVYNGEIYNYQAVKKALESEGVTFSTTSDTEVLLKGFQQWGQKVLDRINGMFAFAIYDKTKNELFIARDRLGVKPLYYKWENGQLEVSSQLSPMETDEELDQEAIDIYLQTGYIPSPKSIYSNIKKLPPGTFARFNFNKASKALYSYWDLERISTTKVTYEQAKRELHDLLRDAVKIRLQADVPYGCFLSGGIDSALVSSLASEALKSPLNTFTIGFKDKKYDESTVAKQFSNLLQTNHTNRLCSEKEMLGLLDDFFKVFDEPFADSSAIPSLLLNKVTKPNATVVLSGDGGDESFLGYNHFEWTKKVSLLYSIPWILRKGAGFIIPFRWLGKRGESIKNILLFRDLSSFIQHIFTGFESLLKKENKQWFSRFSKYLKLSEDKLQQVADLNIRLWLENDSNVKVDRASMAYSVEVRSPFLDYRVVEYARKLPSSFRYNNGTRKRILRDILATYIPEEVFDQPKKGFSIPLGKWIRNELKEEISTYLSEEKLKCIPNLNIKKLTHLFDMHLTKNVDYSSYLWRVYVLSKWIHLNRVNK